MTRGLMDTPAMPVYVVGQAGVAPDSLKYIVQQPDITLPNAQALSPLATGILKSTTATGVLSIAVGADLPAAIQTFAVYVPNDQSAAYTSTPVALLNAATLADLNTLRAAVENLRLAYEDVRTKLDNSPLVV